ncbi:MAG: GH3 auxin-responsive promoter family protein [Bacteroidetes bacterium]|nr:GH3 auxin-responsive promoter family protein [Bacteroidota bacterium]
MAILGTLIKKGLKLSQTLREEFSSPFDLQKNELRGLLFDARNTDFGKYYQFKSLLKTFKGDHAKFYEVWKSSVPLYDYRKMHREWWQLSLQGIKNVSWPGRTKYFALSSGTSESSSKYIPVTRQMTKAIQRTSIRQIVSLSRYDLPSNFFEGGILMIGGSTHLNRRGSYFEGDLSGIQAARLPFWFQHFYKPGKEIARNRNWESKLLDIAKKAKDWDITIIVGVPAWIQILMEKILEHHGVSNIHKIWPNLQAYVHGGVSFDPYRKGFEKLLGKPIHYIETYLASEGFVAYQARPNRRTMKMVLDNGIFFEFIPFDERNFTDSGEVKDSAETFMVDQVEEGKDYALVMSTCAGAWRYLIGDVVRFTSKAEAEIIITGRTKHFLSLCGEHLSVDNMNKAIELVSEELNISILEFTVAGIPHKTLFAHHWFIGCDDRVDKQTLRDRLDHHLQELNDDYAVERIAALKDVKVDVLPTSVFYGYLDSKGKSGGQNKFPRVVKNAQFDDWKKYLNSIKKS